VAKRYALGVNTGRPLRVALVWNNSILFEELFDGGEPVAFGEQGVHPLPNGVALETLELFVPHQGGFALHAGQAGMSGEMWIDGKRTDITGLAGNIPIGRDDYGVVIFGTVAIFFQPVKGALAPRRQGFRLDWVLAASVMLAAFLCAVVGVISVMDYRWRGEAPDPFELDEELISRFLVTPPEDLFEEEDGGTDMEDPGLRQREESGGERQEDEEGRVGREDSPTEDSEFEGDVDQEIVARVETMGLLGALSGGEGSPLDQALDVPTVGDLLAGTGALRTDLGRGSGGAGLRGTGMGGGGTGPGSLYGAGRVGTGIGAGMGGTGMGSGGIGARGRKNREVTISVMRGRPRVNGYLSAEQINRVVRANQAAVRYCYEVEVQRQPNLRGRIEVAWRISLAGRVTSSRVARSTMNNARVEGCIARQVRNWRFPEPDGGEVSVEYPFIFGVQGG
jgi:hypothetical protein